MTNDAAVSFRNPLHPPPLWPSVAEQTSLAIGENSWIKTHVRHGLGLVLGSKKPRFFWLKDVGETRLKAGLQNMLQCGLQQSCTYTNASRISDLE
jgi:hypothetical protein